MFELVGRISAHPLLSLKPICDDIAHANSPPNAATGAVNRVGKYAPAANPAALNAATPTAPTATGQYGGPPQTMDRDSSQNVTPMKTR